MQELGLSMEEMGVKESVSIVSPEEAESTAKAREYFSTAFEFIKERAFKGDSLDWNKIKQKSDEALANVKAPSDTYPIIKQVLRELGDNGHSFLLPPKKPHESTTAKEEPLPLPEGREIGPGVAYLSIPGTDDPKSFPEYIETIQSFIKDLDSKNPDTKWVVDLRHNYGGNMWPMIAGLGPLLGDGRLGSFIYKGGEELPFFYFDGKAKVGNYTAAEADNPYTLLHENPQIAVLTSNKTASSGEIVRIAFEGKPGVRVFGEETRGLPTANETTTLSDGAFLAVTVGITTDRSGRQYDTKIEPDVLISANQNNLNEDDNVMENAVQWLINSPSKALTDSS